MLLTVCLYRCISKMMYFIDFSEKNRGFELEIVYFTNFKCSGILAGFIIDD